MASRPPKRTTKASSKAKVVELSVYVKWAAVSDPVDVATIPADLAAAIAGLRDGSVAHDAACAIAQPYIVANFLVENLAGGDELFIDADEVWATETIVNKLRLVAGQRLPLVTAAAGFRLSTKPGFPADEEAMEAWNEDNGYFPDAVNFFWRFGTTMLVIGDYEEAGGGVDEFP